ncbi:MAG: hypothetical protein HDT33_08530 [Clostridiales bacterium]|nr:hypothetical protein [Clostridiales bacterium]
MNIPITEKEFIQDILENCGKIPAFHGPIWSWANGPIKSRIIEYGIINPIIPEVRFGGWPNEYIKEVRFGGWPNGYIKEIWEMNSNAILSARGLSIDDRCSLIGSSTLKIPHVKDWLLKKEDSDEFKNGWFTNLPYHERKFMMPVRSFDDYYKDISDIQIFRISHIPDDIKFEDCVPTVGELYIAHPYRQGVYLPVSKYEHLIFRERIHELSKVMMALGATEIRTLQNSDNKSQYISENSSNISASVGVERFGAKGAFSSFLKNLNETEKSDSIVINFKNDPIDLPKIPDCLVWYPHDKEWQHIAESRLLGNILEYEINLSSKAISLVSEIERSNIEAQAKALFASGSYSKDSSSYVFFKEESAKNTKIRIKFKSRKDY